MNSTNKKLIKKWIDIWDKADISLRKIKLEELQSEDYYVKNQYLLNEMLQYACDHNIPRLHSGLIEQQQIFKIFYENIKIDTKK